MNRGTAYANAKGFSMGSMAQLMNIKSAIDRSTLLEVLVENLTTCHPTPPAGLDDDGDVAGEQAEATNVRARGDAAGGQGGAAKVQGDSDEQPDDAAGKRARVIRRSDRVRRERATVPSSAAGIPAARRHLQATVVVLPTAGPRLLVPRRLRAAAAVPRAEWRVRRRVLGAVKPLSHDACADALAATTAAAVEWRVSLRGIAVTVK